LTDFGKAIIIYTYFERTNQFNFLFSGEKYMTNLTANASTNYSEEIIKTMVAEYEANPTRETVNALAEQFSKPVRSIISKLSALGVYQKATPATKKAEPIIKKEVYVAKLNERLGIELPSAGNMTKVDIQRLIEFLG
jgi:hypothetical protein